MKFSLFKKLAEEEFLDVEEPLEGYTTDKPLYVCLAQRDNIRALYLTGIITEKQAKTLYNNVAKTLAAYSLYTKHPEEYKDLMSQYYFNSNGDIIHKDSDRIDF